MKRRSSLTFVSGFFTLLACGPAPAPQSAPVAVKSSEPPPAPAPAPPGPVPATIRVDAERVVSLFKSLHVFGNNVPAWVDPVPVRQKIEAAGNYLLRIPGGSWGDVYHWNGKGSYDREGRWLPSRTEYEPSWLEKDYQSKYFSTRAHDGDPKTAWLSHADTDFPNGQWIYLDLGEAREVDGVAVTWGTVAEKKLPHAKLFSVEAWDPAVERQYMVYGAEKSAWQTLLADVKGTGGAQTVAFPKTKTQFVRLLFTRSSAGARGQYSVAEYQVLSGGKPAPLAGWIPCVASSTAVVGGGRDERKIFGFEEYMEFFHSFSPRKAVPLVIVNFGTGTPEEAAAWVHYANRVRGYEIRYWEIGNEMGGHWEAGGPLNVVDYARRYIEFYEAMKKEDPSITIIAQTGALEASGVYDGVPVLRAFVDRLAKDEKERYLDAFSVHQYPNWGQPVAELLESPPGDMKKLADSIAEQLRPYPSLARVPVWISEFNTSDHVKPDVSVRLDNGLWLAQYLGEFIRHFGLRGYATLWDVMNGGTAIKEANGGDHGYLQAEEGPYQHQERADYWTMQLLATRWAVPADERQHQLLGVESDEPWLAAYATLRPDGELALAVVNKHREQAFSTTLDIKGFTPRSGKAWVLDETRYRWRTDSLPYHADPSRPPAESTLTVADGAPAFTFPAYSVSVVRFAR